ncbi:MAG: DEAD/DEAH box helicase [Spirochaetota bacterium]
MKQQQWAPGQRVVIRDAEWRIKRVEPVDGREYCLETVGVSPFVKDREALFLTSLEDTIEHVDPVDTQLTVDTSSQFRSTRLYLETLLRTMPPRTDKIVRGHRGAMDLVPYQLDPARQALSEPRCRILIADAVGLGKTVEAGVLISDLIARGRGKRILVIALKSMLTQFQKELWTRFTIPLVRLDSAGISRIRNHIPANYNPFYYYDKTIISIDTLKQESEYRVWLEHSYWDIIVIDEAQNVARRSTKSQRHKLADRLAARCDSLIMLSATPHDGRRESFASLMNMLNPAALPDDAEYSRQDISGLFIRRFKKDIQDQVSGAFPERKINQYKFAARPQEEAVLLKIKALRFGERLTHGSGGTLLFRTVLEKAFLSSPAACRETVENRLRSLRQKDNFLDNMDEIQEMEELLSALQALPFQAQGKYKGLLQVIEDWPQDDPRDRIVIFTERIVTMHELAAALRRDLQMSAAQIRELHGSMSDGEIQQLVEDFGKEESPVRILVASDVAAEGINLHYLSHRLVHFDIPWSLMVFQQRNGRIDRYGQEQQPLISYLLTQYEQESLQGDQRILELLIKKDEQVQQNIGDPGEFTGLYEAEAEEVLTGRAMEEAQSPAEFEERLQSAEAEDDFFARLFADLPSEDAAEPTTAQPPATARPPAENKEEEPAQVSLYRDDFSFYHAAVHTLASLRSREELKYEADASGETVAIWPPKAFKAQEKFLPREVVPEKEDPYILTADRQRIMDAMVRCRKEESAWPREQLLWDQHPLMEWLQDELMSLFSRNETPLLAVPGLAAGSSGELLCLMYGLIPNRRGQTVVHHWFGLLYRAGEFQETLSLEHSLRRTGLSAGRVPNSGRPAVPAQPRPLLEDAYRRALDILSEKRREFNETTAPIIQAEYDRLNKVKQKKLKQLQLQFDQRQDTGSRLARKWLDSHSQQAEEDFQNYIQWIKDHIQTEDSPYIQFAALCSGEDAEPEAQR